MARRPRKRAPARARWLDAYGFEPYVPVAERRERAQRVAAALSTKGRQLAPARAAGRRIAVTFWGAAWCDNLERYSDYANRLPRGRTYLRNGSVIDLQIGPGEVAAVVSGTDIYHVSIKVAAAPAQKWQAICRRCAGEIDSVVELLQGRFSKGVMEHLCRQDTGLFPAAREIRFSCTCPDAASMCKHVAAALYGVGARLDDAPGLLFRLRGVDEQELIAGAARDLPLSAKGPSASRVLADADLGEVFGLDLETPPAAVAEARPSAPAAGRKQAARRPAAKKRPAAAGKGSATGR
ncbi:MAG TPA: hypothetical protein VK911_15670 [Vicinamibacterales bacterium]|nr:hypothetical protein [Vicinamibacterales bacterium]